MVSVSSNAPLTAATLLRSWRLTLWTFWQNAAQLQIYGPHANTLVDKAGVIQIFRYSVLRITGWRKTLQMSLGESLRMSYYICQLMSTCC